MALRSTIDRLHLGEQKWLALLLLLALALGVFAWWTARTVTSQGNLFLQQGRAPVAPTAQTEVANEGAARDPVGLRSLAAAGGAHAGLENGLLTVLTPSSRDATTVPGTLSQPELPIPPTGTLIEVPARTTRAPREVATGARRAERPATSDDRIVVDGLLSPRVVAREIEERKGALISAYERALRDRPELRGRVTVTFVINKKGAVRDVVITHDTLDDERVARDIKTAISGWRFPLPPTENLCA